MKAVKVFWRWLTRHGDWERQLDSEIREHIERRTQDLVQRGMHPAEAKRRARIEFGPLDAYKEQCREEHGWGWPAEFAQDLRHGMRMLRRSKRFTAIAVLSLALGIGANMVVFGVLNGLLLRPLPIRDPERVYFVNNKSFPAQTFPNYLAMRDRNVVFDSLFAYRIMYMAVEASTEPQHVWGYLVTGNYFESLGVKPAVGRFFTTAEDRARNASPYAVLSYTCWQNRFGGDPAIAGRTVRINGLPYTVLGVAPKGFRGTEVFYAAEIWVPMSMEAQIEGWNWLDDTHSSNAWIAGRLKPGISQARAEANLAAIAQQLASEREENEGLKFALSRPGLVGSLPREPVQAFAGGVMLLAAIVLIVACTNLASMLAVRSADRRRELAIRLSIGASRGRVLRQLLTETIPISILGGALGCGIAAAGLRVLSRWRVTGDLPMQFDVDADGRVFLFVAAATLLSGIFFGLAPARQVWKADPNRGLKGLGREGERSRWVIRDIVLASQVALCCLLVMASIVSVRGLARSLTAPVGFEMKGAAVAGFDLGPAGYQGARAAIFERQARDAVARIPGVTAAAYASSLPLSIDQSSTFTFPPDTVDFLPSKAILAHYYQVSPGYFQAMGTRILAGRDFSDLDQFGGKAVAIINRTMLRRLLGIQEPAKGVGKHFLYGSKVVIEIVGVIEDGKYSTLAEAPDSAVFWPLSQMPSNNVVMIARSSRPESEVAAEMRRAIAKLDPHLPVYNTGSLAQLIGMVYLPAQAAVFSLGAFGVLAILLAVTGIYGVAAHGVSGRLREIGIRMSIGARPAQVLRLILGRTSVFVGVGCVIGAGLGAGAAQLLASIVYQASPRDPVVITTVAAVMAVTAIAAVLGPARRALTVDPVSVLRED